MRWMTWLLRLAEMAGWATTTTTMAVAAAIVRATQTGCPLIHPFDRRSHTEAGQATSPLVSRKERRDSIAELRPRAATVAAVLPSSPRV